jgi:SPP1 family predicted phage head-tail adaptor
VEIQEAKVAIDDHRARTRTWATVDTVWASVEPLSGREALIAKQVDARLTHRVIIRYWAGLTPTHRIRIDDTRALGIIEIKDIELRHRSMELLCYEDAVIPAGVAS